MTPFGKTTQEEINKARLFVHLIISQSPTVFKIPTANQFKWDILNI